MDRAEATIIIYAHVRDGGQLFVDPPLIEKHGPAVTLQDMSDKDVITIAEQIQKLQ